MRLAVVLLVLGPAISHAEDGQPIDLSKLARVVVHPDVVRMSGHLERQRLVVTGTTAGGNDGPRWDLGRSARYEAVPVGVVEVYLLRAEGRAWVEPTAGDRVWRT